MTDAAKYERDTLCYDGRCPFCTAEVCELSGYAGEQLKLEDINQLKNKKGLPDQKTLLGRLHLKTGDGEWLVGIDANIRAWRHTPSAGLWRILGWPIIRIFSSMA